MKEEQKEESPRIMHIFIIGIITALMILTTAVIFSETDLFNERFNRAKEKALDVIDEKPINTRPYNQGYRQGWLDALETIEAWYNTGTNVTTTEINAVVDSTITSAVIGGTFTSIPPSTLEYILYEQGHYYAGYDLTMARWRAIFGDTRID